MAIRTQIRLPQITGSFGSSGINDQIASAATGSINAGDIQTVLSHMAGAIKRIHGADSFSEQVAGGFSQGIIVQSGDGIYIGADADEFSITEASNDITMNVEQTDKDLIFKASPGGVSTEIARIDGSASSLLMASSKKIEFGDADTYINQVSDGVLQLRSDTTVKAVIGATDALTINSSGATFGQDVTVTGNLTVNGTTTQVDTTNLNVADKNILLNDGGAATSAGGAGIDVEEDSAVTGYLKVSSDRNAWEMKAPNNAGVATFDIDATKTITIAGALNIEGDSNINQDVTTDASVIFGDVTANGGVVIDNITIDGTSIALSSGDLTLDVAGDIILDADSGAVRIFDNSVDVGLLLNSVDYGLILSSSAQTNVAIDSNNGQIFLMSQGGDSTTIGSIAMQSNSIYVGIGDQNGGDYPASGFIQFNTEAASAPQLLSGSIGLAIDAGANSAQLRIKSNGGGYVAIASPDSLSGAANWTLTLPSDNGSANQILQTDGNGVTSWVSQGGASNSVKTFATVESTIASNNNLSSDNGYATTDYSAISTANASKAIDVYVNGQLMQSGSGPYTTDVSSAGFTSGDYLADTLNMSALDVKFAFNLEADDVVCIIGRA